MRLAVLGGSFNPIHIGHLYLADSVLTTLGYDRLVFVPANTSPFKQHSAGSVNGAETAAAAFIGTASGTPAAGERLEMVLASITADPRFTASDLEIRRGGISYTIDTLEEIIERYRPSGKPGLVLGDDLAADFCRWRRVEEIAGLADIIVARRVNVPFRNFPYPHKMLDNDIINISSAMIRERIAGAVSGAWRSLIPQGVRRIIEERRLYLLDGTCSGESSDSALGEKSVHPGDRTPGTGSLLFRVEEAAREALSTGRFLHSRNTALMARDIALCYKLDGEAAYLAGIAHDMGKSAAPGLGHGKAAAVLLQERFGIHNKDILEAVEVHTTGRPGMGDLAKAVFIADKIEYSRSRVQSCFREAAGCLRPQEQNKTGFSGLDDFFHAVLEDNVRWLKEAGIVPAEETQRLLVQRP